MLRMSKLADYGTVLMAAMARDPDALHSATGLASKLGMGTATVSKILKTLVRESLVASTRGVHGGYRLLRSPSDISVAQVIRALDGPIGMTECSTTPGLCSQESRCTVRANWMRVNHVVLEVLNGITLDQLNRPAPGVVKVESIGRRGARALTGRAR
jgi:FeS assembly SUF system regulator